MEISSSDYDLVYYPLLPEQLTQPFSYHSEKCIEDDTARDRDL
jgi:hypothetical protein